MKTKILFIILTIFFLQSCGKDDENTTECTQFTNNTNIDLGNPPDDYASLFSEIIIDNGLLISDINVKIKTECPNDICGLKFDEIFLLFTDEEDNQTIIFLVNSFAEVGETFTDVTFDNEAVNSVDTESKPLIGRFKPVGDLSNLYGTNSKGRWTLVFTNLDSFDIESNTILDSWSLEICNN